MFGPLLNHFKQVLAIVIVSNQVSTINNEDKRWCALFSSGQSNLFKLIEGSFDIQQGRGITRATDTEKAANVAVESVRKI